MARCETNGKLRKMQRSNSSTSCWAIDSPINRKHQHSTIIKKIQNKKEKQNPEKTVETTIAAVNQTPWHNFCDANLLSIATIGNGEAAAIRNQTTIFEIRKHPHRRT